MFGVFVHVFMSNCANTVMPDMCLHATAYCSSSLTSHFLDHSKEDLSFAEDSSRLVFIWKVEFKWAVFPVVYGVPVSWCRVVSKTIGIIVRLAGRKWRSWYWGAKCALACVMEGWVVGSRGCREGMGREWWWNTAGQGGNRGGAVSQACRVAAKPTVMLATGIGCCGPQVVLVCTSKGQAVNMKTQLILS